MRPETYQQGSLTEKIDRMDALSRTRALTYGESMQLEHWIRKEQAQIIYAAKKADERFRGE